MDEQTRNLLIVTILMIAFVLVVLFLIGGIGMGMEGLSGKKVFATLWDQIGNWINIVMNLGQVAL